MNAVLALNGARLAWSVEETGQWIVRAAQGQAGEAELTNWLRGRAGAGA